MNNIIEKVKEYRMKRSNAQKLRDIRRAMIILDVYAEKAQNKS